MRNHREKKRKKRRKITSVGGNPDPAPLVSRDNDGNGIVPGQSNQIVPANDEGNDNINQVFVEDSKVKGANGAYTRHPTEKSHGAACFTKKATRKAKRWNDIIFCNKKHYWCIGSCTAPVNSTATTIGPLAAVHFRTMNPCREGGANLPLQGGLITMVGVGRLGIKPGAQVDLVVRMGPCGSNMVGFTFQKAIA